MQLVLPSVRRLACAVAHGVHNAFTYAFMVQAYAGDEAVPAAGGQGIDPMLLTGSLLLLAVAWRRLPHRRRGEA